VHANLEHITLRRPVFDRDATKESWWDYFNRKTLRMPNHADAVRGQLIAFISDELSAGSKDIYWCCELNFVMGDVPKRGKERLLVTLIVKVVDVYSGKVGVDNEDKYRSLVEPDFKRFADELGLISGINFPYEAVLDGEEVFSDDEKIKTLLLIDDLDRLLERAEEVILKKENTGKDRGKDETPGL